MLTPEIGAEAIVGNAAVASDAQAQSRLGALPLLFLGSALGVLRLFGLAAVILLNLLGRLLLFRLGLLLLFRLWLGFGLLRLLLLLARFGLRGLGFFLLLGRLGFRLLFCRLCLLFLFCRFLFLFRFGLLLGGLSFLLVVLLLREGRNSGSESEEECCRADDCKCFHAYCLH